jgi:predicted metal-dependent enzyme (double-stranded beta helix superfamily)
MRASREERGMAELMDAFIAECLEVRETPDWAHRVEAALSRRMADPAFAEEIVRETGEAKTKIFIHSPRLTAYSIWSDGGLRSPPHDHAGEAVVALIKGVEQYKTYLLEGERCVETGLQRVVAPTVAVMPAEAVHAMWNEPAEGGLSLHIYGNIHFDVPGRRMWDPVTFEERPFDFQQHTAWSKDLIRAARG